MRTRIHNLLENLQTTCLESNKVATVCFLCFYRGRILRVISAEQKRRRDFEFFVDQATPGFELGKKDLQSPALPLGHAAKMIQNR